jgi:hypothetical protein
MGYDGQVPSHDDMHADEGGKKRATAKESLHNCGEELERRRQQDNKWCVPFRPSGGRFPVVVTFRFPCSGGRRIPAGTHSSRLV